MYVIGSSLTPGENGPADGRTLQISADFFQFLFGNGWGRTYILSSRT